MITLLSDFGLSDAYVGIMKGVILGINPDVKLVDLSHHIPAQDIQTAGFHLANAHPYFPKGTIHLVVVDPGVGSQREAVAVELEHSILVGPNNGVFSNLLQKEKPFNAVILDKSEYWSQVYPSTTFHGRDIFAPVAAHLSTGLSIAQVGTPLSINQLVLTNVNRRNSAPEAGYIQAIDHFGNLITSIPSDAVQGRSHWHIHYQDQYIQGKSTYSSAAPGELVALIGSHGFIEIAINQGNAQAHLGATVNMKVSLQPPPCIQ